jgi:ABC-2 type transport system permease protein
MRLVVAHASFQGRELLNYPAFVLPTVALPALFFLLFAAPRSDHASAPIFLALYAAFAVLGVAFFQFGVGIAAERGSPWELFLRTLPVSPLVRFAARLLVGLAFASAAAFAVAAVATVSTPVVLGAARWAELALALVLGGIPFGLLGIAVGYLTAPRVALPLANLLYLLLAYTGGLWTRPEELPAFAARISPLLPTRQWADVLAAAVTDSAVPLRAIAGLCGYTLGFGALALAAYRRDEGERFA